MYTHAWLWCFFILLSYQNYGQSALINWGNELGGLGTDLPCGIEIRADSGYIVTGHTNSVNDGDVVGSIGLSDFWLLGISDSGDLSWQNVIGGSYNEYAYGFDKINDTSYIIVGKTYSNDVDVTGLHGAVNSKSDAWVVKVGAKGQIIWQKVIGGTDEDEAFDVQVTSDGGFIIVGASQSKDADVLDSISYHQVVNAWVLKLDATGNIEWSKLYGGNSVDYGYAIEQTADGGYIFTGDSFSNNGDLSGSNGSKDLWAVKLNAQGDIEWSKLYGGTGNETGQDILQTAGGDYMIIGSTSSMSGDGDISTNKGGTDIWLVKVNVNGNIIWEKTYGGFFEDFGTSLILTSTNHYLIGGKTNSDDGDITGLHGIPGGFYEDSWVAKVDTSSVLLWGRVFGGSLGESVSALVQSEKQGVYGIANMTNSTDGDIALFNKAKHGGDDMWIIELDEKLPSSLNYSTSIDHDISAFPNPFSRSFVVRTPNAKYDILSIKAFDFLGREIETLKQVQSDGSLVIDGTGWESGVYFIQVQTDMQLKMMKLVKQ